MMQRTFLIALACFLTGSVFSQGKWERKFEQLGPELPTPNSYRAGSGAPGKDYWQQRADYVMDVTLDDKSQKISGNETITYFNNSPDQLNYLWLQLDQNMRAKDSSTPLATSSSMDAMVSGKELVEMIQDYDYEGGFNITKVTDQQGKPLKYTINQTMMRVELPKPIDTGGGGFFQH